MTLSIQERRSSTLIIISRWTGQLSTCAIVSTLTSSRTSCRARKSKVPPTGFITSWPRGEIWIPLTSNTKKPESEASRARIDKWTSLWVLARNTAALVIIGTRPQVTEFSRGSVWVKSCKTGGSRWLLPRSSGNYTETLNSKQATRLELGVVSKSKWTSHCEPSARNSCRACWPHRRTSTCAKVVATPTSSTTRSLWMQSRALTM